MTIAVDWQRHAHDAHNALRGIRGTNREGLEKLRRGGRRARSHPGETGCRAGAGSAR